MRIAVIALVSLLAVGCSTTNHSCLCDRGGSGPAEPTFVDTDDDGLPDTRVSAGDVEVGQTRVVFVAGHDGLPDQRIVGVVERGSDGDHVLVSKDGMISLPGRQPRGEDDRLRAALDGLERAIAEVRRALH